MAFTYALTGKGDPSTVLRSDGREIPQDPANADYQLWVAFTTGGGVTTPAPTIAIEDRRATAKGVVARIAASTAKTLTDEWPRDDLYNALRFQEAMDYERFETDDTNDAAYVLLGAEVDALDEDRDTVDKVHDLVLAELAALKTDLAAIATAHAATSVEIDDCDTQAEIDAVLASVDLAP